MSSKKSRRMFAIVNADNGTSSSVLRSFTLIFGLLNTIFFNRPRQSARCGLAFAAGVSFSLRPQTV